MTGVVQLFSKIAFVDGGIDVCVCRCHVLTLISSMTCQQLFTHTQRQSPSLFSTEFLAKRFAWDIKPKPSVLVDSSCFFSTAPQKHLNLLSEPSCPP